MLQNSVGNLGTYGSGRSVMDHRGSLLYLGPRKKGHRRQPTVSKGPNEPGIAREYQFGFHRKNMSHKYWSFINAFLNLIVSGTTMAAFYIIHTWQSSFQYQTQFNIGRNSVHQE
jgi:hypothetical protein